LRKSTFFLQIHNSLIASNFKQFPETLFKFSQLDPTFQIHCSSQRKSEIFLAGFRFSHHPNKGKKTELSWPAFEKDKAKPGPIQNS
jgi:hypothetical protein